MDAEATSTRARSPDGAPATSGVAVPHFASLHAGYKLAVAALLGLVLANCSSTLLYTELPPATTRSIKPGAEPPPANQREHQRILAAYNGAYAHTHSLVAFN